MNIQEIRRQFHKIAEISGKEINTSQTIANILKELNPDLLIEQFNDTFSLAAVFEGNKEGKSLCFRADIDALPISESRYLEHKSNSSDISHKCGHDGHIAILLGLAEKLAGKEFPGRIVLLFQAEEETGTGAEKVLKDTRFLNLNIYKFYGLHNLPGFKEKSIITKKDTFASASKGIIINLEGETSHAAEPENGNSPLLAMTSIINTLLALPQRNTNFNDSNLVTIIHAKLGEEAFGTSPGKAVIMATLRSDSEHNMRKMAMDIETAAEGIATSFKLSHSISYKEVFPATVNHDLESDIVKQAAQNLKLEIIEKDKPFAWSEDFGHYLNYKPGSFFGLGAGENTPNLHNPDYDFNDDIIQSGIDMFWNILLLENDES